MHSLNYYIIPDEVTRNIEKQPSDDEDDGIEYDENREGSANGAISY